MLMFFLKGLIVGLSIAAPVGPIGVLCIRRSLANGRTVGFVTGLGAATADAVYGAVAAFGLTTVSSFLVGQKLSLALLGGAFLCYVGIRTFLAPPASEAASSKTTTLLSSYISTVFLTLSNPATILSFIAIFAGFGLGTSVEYKSATLLVAGVFIGSASWWLILSNGVSYFRDRLNRDAMRWVNRFSGMILFAFGSYSVASALFALFKTGN